MLEQQLKHLNCAGFLAATLVLHGLAHAQAPSSTYPTRPVRLVVPFAAGGTNDILGRIVAEKFAEKFTQPFVADNRAGANGNIAYEMTARAVPDGSCSTAKSPGTPPPSSKVRRTR